MALLQCEICGGRLTRKTDGIYECDFCGIQYDTAWAQAKIQEIKGTVKVEGTVEVTGSVKIDGPIQVEGSVSKENLLERGNLALADGHWKEAEDFFDRVLNMEPHSAQAYLGKYMAWMKAKDFENLKKLYEDADEKVRDHGFLKRAKQFADASLTAELDILEELYQANQNSMKELRSSLFSKAEGRLYCSEYAVAAKTLDDTLLIKGHHQRLLTNENGVLVYDFEGDIIFEYVPFNAEWKNIDKVFRGVFAASSCPGGYKEICFDTEGNIAAVDYTGNVFISYIDEDNNSNFQKTASNWKDVDFVIALSDYYILARTKWGTAYLAKPCVNQNPVNDWKNVAHIALNLRGAFGLTEDGTVYCHPLSCGEKADKMVAEVTAWRDIKQIVVDQLWIVGLTNQGEVKFYGDDEDRDYDIVKMAVSEWRGVKRLDVLRTLTCVFEDGTACNVHDGMLPGDWSSAKTLCYDNKEYYGLAEDGTVCVGQKDPLPDGVLKQQYPYQLHADGTLSGLKTKKKVLDFENFPGYSPTDDCFYSNFMVLYEDGTVEVVNDSESQSPLEYRTTEWKLFQSIKTFEEEYAKGLQKKQKIHGRYEKAIAKKLAEIEETRARQEEKQRSDDYEKACALLAEKQFAADLMEALSIFEKLKDYRDSAEKIPLCQAVLSELREQERVRRMQLQYQKACEDMKRNKIPVLQMAICNFNDLGDWEDSADRILRCKEKIEMLKRRDSLHSKKNNLEKELGKLGLFARKRKKEIAAQIESIEKEIDRINREELN